MKYTNLLLKSGIQKNEWLRFTFSYVNNSIDSLDIPDLKKSKIKKVLYLINDTHWMHSRFLYDYVEVAGTRFKKAVGNNYKEYVDILLELELIEVNQSYQVGVKSKSYRPKYYSSKLQLSSFKKSFKESIEALTLDVLHRLTVRVTNIQGIEDIAMYEANSSDIRKSIKVDDEITDKTLRVSFNGSEYQYKSVAWIKAFARSKGLNVIQKKHKYTCIIADLDQYTRDKRMQLLINYANALLDIHQGKIRATRNPTNQRLDTNITSMYSPLMQYLKLDGEDLIQLDLCNSQFVFFVNYFLVGIKDKEIQDFSHATRAGKLYEHLMLEIEQYTSDTVERSEAKKIAFLVAFGKPAKEDDDNKYRAMFAKVFPKVNAIINEYKMKNGYKAFPVKLQTLESQLFIDGILRELYNNNLKVLTKHDSVICKQRDFIKVNRIVESNMDRYFGGGGYTLKIENV